MVRNRVMEEVVDFGRCHYQLRAIGVALDYRLGKN